MNTDVALVSLLPAFLQQISLQLLKQVPQIQNVPHSKQSRTLRPYEFPNSCKLPNS